MDKVYKFGAFAQLIGVCLATLKNWDKRKILIAKRTPTGRRFYTHEQYLTYIRGKNGKRIYG